MWLFWIIYTSENLKNIQCDMDIHVLIYKHNLVQCMEKEPDLILSAEK